MLNWIQSLFGLQRSTKSSKCTIDDSLIAAAENGCISDILSLLESDACVNATSKQGSTPLHLAVRGNHASCVEVLIQHPTINLQKLDKWGRSPLHTAVVWQRLDLLRRLIEHDCDLINVKDADGKTMLHYTSANGAYEYVKFLIDSKADLNVQDHRKWTPLMCAVSIQSVPIVRLLLEHGANCNQPARVNCCTSALQLAIEKHNLSIVNLLLENGALVEYTLTITLGSFTRTSGHRQSNICHNLATLAIDSVDLCHPQSIEIAEKVVQASPTAPDEESCIKLYEVYIKPSKRLRRVMSRELMHLIETINESTVLQLVSLLSLSFAVGVDLSKSNVDRLKRKYDLDEKQDSKLFELIDLHRKKSLKLQSALAVRKRLIECGHKNILSSLLHSQFPSFIKELILLDWH